MEFPNEDQDRIVNIARESLDTFARVSGKAEVARKDASRRIDTPLAADPLTFPKAAANLRRIHQDLIENYEILLREPAIARVVALDEGDGRTRTTYYICRVAPPEQFEDKSIKLASYRSPIGRLAALPIGGHELRLDNRVVSVEILESAKLEPSLVEEEWDAKAFLEEFRLTIDSLQTFLKHRDGTGTTQLDILLAEERDYENVREGLRRSVIASMSLRDQPILDQYQDDIFRLPLNSRLMILGAPGTGKTTTLIRRLGQKLDVDFLEEDERQAIEVALRGRQVERSRNWVMFTPTELLKLYVQEAFNREGIPAPDDHIRTWADFRDDLARNEFGILQSSPTGGGYVMTDSAQTIKAETVAKPVEWFSDFDNWQKMAFWEEMRANAESLSESSMPEAARLGKRLLKTLGATGTNEPPSMFVTLTSVAGEIRELLGPLKESSNKKILGALNLQVNRNQGFLDELAAFVESLSDLDDDSEDQNTEDEEEPNRPRVVRARAAARDYYMRAVRAQARAQTRNRNVSESSKTGRIIEWLGERLLPERDLREVGESLALQSILERFANPVRRYITNVPRRYRQYRRIRQSEEKWFYPEGFNHQTDIHPLEIDAILLAILRSTDQLLQGASALVETGNPLDRLQHLYRTQVLVDEATDFSPIQLSCMATLASPGTRSFFACGDFNQRVTDWGTRSVDEIEWAIANIEIRTISVPYRQSRRLSSFAREIIRIYGGSVADVGLLSEDYPENEGVPPVLAENLAERSGIANWLALRIREIEEFLGTLPSIAVLVNGEEEVRPLSSALMEALAEYNIRVIACSDGQVKGRNSAVRVFSIEHIKGLEFEAVFFVGIDKFADALPDLFDKYLYVGATRATTYLGITCEQTLPLRMSELQGHFHLTWQ